MYKIKSTAGEVKVLCKAYLKEFKANVKNRRVQYIHEHINDKDIFGRKKYNSVKDVIRYMKTTRGTSLDSIWGDFSVQGSFWRDKANNLYKNVNKLPDSREIWLEEGLSFLFGYKINTSK